MHIVLLKTLLLKYIALGENQVANIVWGKVKCCICHETLTKRLYISYKRSSSASSVLLYFTLKEVLAKYISLKFNALSTRLLNRQWFSLIKMYLPRVYNGKRECLTAYRACQMIAYIRVLWLLAKGVNEVYSLIKMHNAPIVLIYKTC